MISKLKIKNLILIDEVEICFEKGLNILTGETGSGKSAILSAIRLITGARAEADLVGKNGNLAVIEAVLSPKKQTEKFVSANNADFLTIRREIHSSGKSRCFANDELISLTSLRQLIGESIEIIDQSSSHALQNSEEQRKILDTYIEAPELIRNVASLFTENQRLENKVKDLSNEVDTKDRELTWAKEDLHQIDETNWQAGEEEELSSKHKKIFEATQNTERLSLALELLESSTLKQAIAQLEAFPELLLPLKNALIEIEEVERIICSKVNSQDTDLDELEKCEQRMKSLDQLKRSFGKSLDLVEAKRKELNVRIDHLENLEYEIEKTKEQLSENNEKFQKCAQELSKIRKIQAPLLSKKILEILITLNLKNAQFQIELEKISSSPHGLENPRFLFSANAGHQLAPIEDCASGGELARLLFSLKVALFNKESNDCLIFDEIDSNVGGLTATVLGEKLKDIAMFKQVICITHFVQVARFANLHFVVTKEVIGENTISTIKRLEKGEESSEYSRMLGSEEMFQMK